MTTSVSSANTSATTSHTASLPSAVTDDLLVLAVAVSNGSDVVTTPPGWTLEQVESSGNLTLYLFTHRGSAGSSVGFATISSCLSSHACFNFGNVNFGSLAPVGTGNSSFDIQHSSFSASIPAGGAEFCSVAAWEFTRSLSLWPPDYPNAQQSQIQNNCNLAASTSATGLTTQPSRPDYTISNAAPWVGVGFFVSPASFPRECPTCSADTNRRNPCSCFCSRCWGCKKRPTAVILTPSASDPTCCKFFAGTWALDDTKCGQLGVPLYTPGYAICDSAPYTVSKAEFDWGLTPRRRFYLWIHIHIVDPTTGSWSYIDKYEVSGIPGGYGNCVPGTYALTHTERQVITNFLGNPIPCAVPTASVVLP